MGEEIIVPELFCLEPFYQQGDKIQLNKGLPLQQRLMDDLFYDDINFYIGNNEEKPWKDKETSLKVILQIWQENHSVLTTYFQKRDRKKAIVPMVHSITLFIQYLHWLNNQSVNGIKEWERELEQLQHKPVNVVERFSFILKNPSLFHSFVQLKAMFEESEKLFYKVLLIEKKSI
ncbi:YpoC family protein [Bacillus sp. FJAT-45350]|uniref:YpoC family protein n=1 Tax=Bacillus sp. FJAT-45350 TaxID=2011014 RepID=UPI000BB6A3EE|nr:hypothetical protein [Bacillus sp. FJAT-45350]